MIVAFDETQLLVREAAQGICRPEPGAAPRAPREAWRQFAEMGWPGVALDERFGGSGGSLIDAGIIALEMGRGGLFHGYADTVALSRALAAVGAVHADLLKRVAGGHTALVFPLRLDEAGDEALLAGLAAAETLALDLVGSKIVAMPVEQARPAQAVSRGQDRLLDLGAAAGTALLDGSAAQRVWDQAVAAYRCLACAQLVGVGRHFLDLADDYARVRSQFGKLIGSFQSVQHALVETFAAADAAELLAFKALQAVDGGAGADHPVVAGAVSFVREAVWTMLMKSYDVLGGVGYMEEHPLSRYTRGMLPLLASLGTAEACDEAAGHAVRKGSYLR